MNKAEVIAAVADKAGTSNKIAGDCIEAFFSTVADVVSTGKEKIAIPGWIAFEQTKRAPRLARNPRTGEAIKVPASKGVKISVGTRLKEAARGTAKAAAKKAPAKKAAAKKR